MVITDVDGTIEYVNPKFIEVTGYTTEEAIGQNPRFLQSKTHPPEFYEELWRTIKEGNVWHGEFCNKKKNGEIYFESATIAPNRDKQGQITHFVAIKEDITGQRRIAEELRQAKEAAEAANRAKSDFLASMSHELRTPLGAIIGFSELLEEKLFGDLTPKQDEYIKDILGSSRHLLSLINDVLDLAKVEAGKMDLVLSTFSIGTLLGSSLVMVKEKCLKHGITLSMKIADTITGLQITADERKLKQVMFNLLSNAVKFTPDEGVITVSVDFEKAEGSEQNPSATPALLINVSDTGIGIAKEHQEAVFAEFYQVDGGVKGKTPGTGLGLSLSRRLVELQGGRLWVGSEGEGKGSMFQFTIPIEAYESAGVVESGREGHSLVMRRVSDLVDRALASVDRFCLCRLEPLESMTAVAQEAMVHELNAGKRDHDSIVVDPKGHCVLMLSNTNRAGAEVACRRLAARLEKRLNVGWRWAVAVCPEDGRTAELLMESLRLRCGTAQQNEHENDGERRWAL